MTNNEVGGDSPLVTAQLVDYFKDNDPEPMIRAAGSEMVGHADQGHYSRLRIFNVDVALLCNPARTHPVKESVARVREELASVGEELARANAKRIQMSAEIQAGLADPHDEEYGYSSLMDDLGVLERQFARLKKAVGLYEARQAEIDASQAEIPPPLPVRARPGPGYRGPGI